MRNPGTLVKAVEVGWPRQVEIDKLATAAQPELRKGGLGSRLLLGGEHERLSRGRAAAARGRRRRAAKLGHSDG